MMPRTSGSTRKKGNVSSVAMKSAIDLHLNGYSIRHAAKESHIPYQTLQRYVAKFKKGQLTRFEPNYSINKVFSDHQELSLKQYIVECAAKFYGLTTKECRKLAYEMAKLNKIKMPESWEHNKMAGKDWLRGFKARFSDLSVKKPEACSMARATAFNRTNVQNFYKNLKEVCDRYPCFADGRRIYNLDETSTTTVQRPQRVLAQKGRSVCKVTSGERGVLVTTCCIVNALGQALPPVMVFPRKNFKSHMLHGAPPGTLGLANPSGWMNSDLFVDVMRHFIKYTSASKDNPALIIMDNHESHLSIEALDLAKANGITILTLHPHTTAKMQPLDVGLHAPFKTFYHAAVDSYLMRNPGKIMTIYNVAECVGIAYLKSMTPTNITNSFKKCGIFPFDDNIFDELDFLPSSVTDRPYVEEDNDVTDMELSPIPPANIYEEPAEVLDTSPSLLTHNMHGESCTFNLDTVAPSPVQKSEYTALSPISQNIRPTTPFPNFISPKDFRKPLIAEPRKKKLMKRKLGKSIIATDTPEKEELAKKKKINREKTRRVAKKVKQDLFKKNNKINKNKKLNKQAIESSDTSNDENEDIIYSGSSSGGEVFVSESEDEEILNDDFPPLKRDPRPNDYVLVHFNLKKDCVYFVAQIIELLTEEDECDYFVSYLKLKSKVTQKFTEPIEPDTAGVKKEDIRYILPAPKLEGTSRRTSTYKFPVDMSLLKLRF